MSDTIRPDDDELLRKHIDGEATPVEAAALEGRIAEVPQLRARSDTLKRLLADLGRIGMADPPPGFAAQVMRSVREGRTSGATAWARAVRATFIRRPAFGYGLSLAAGLVVGALAIGLGDAGPAGDSAATALPARRLESARILDRQGLSGGGVEGEAVTRRTPEGLIVEVRIASGGPADVSVDFDAGAFSPVGYRREGGGTPAQSMSAGRFRLSQASPGTYWLTLAVVQAGTPPVRVGLEAGGGHVEKNLRTSN